MKGKSFHTEPFTGSGKNYAKVRLPFGAGSGKNYAKVGFDPRVKKRVLFSP